MGYEILDEINFPIIVDEINPIIVIEDFTIIYANKKFTELFGNAVGKKCYEVIHATASPPSFCAILNLISGGKGEEEFYEPNLKRWFFVKVSRIDSRFLHLIVDITEKIELLKKVEEKEKFYRTLLEIAVPIFIVQNGVFVYVNSQFSELLGYAKEELLGKSPFEFVHPEDREKVKRRYESRIKGERLDEDYPIRILTKSGERWVIISPRRIEYNGNPAVLGVVYDLDEHIRQRNIVLTLHRLLRHDLKNALSAALMSLELLKEGQMSLEKVENSIRKALEIVEHSKIEELKPVDLAELAERASDNIDAEIVIKGNCVILADDSLFSVFNNIFENAVKHGKASRIEVTIEKKGRDCEIRIADNGIGVPEELKEKIFEGYSATGSGIGLKAVREIVRNFNGNIWIEDRPGGGAVFVIRFKDCVI